MCEIYKLTYSRTRSLYFTGSERISSISWQARTHWKMIDDFTMSISTAHAWTWISAMLVETSQMTFAIPINNALGLTTIYIRIADKWRYACAFGYTVDHRTNSVFATR